MSAQHNHRPWEELRNKPPLIQHMHLVSRSASYEVRPGLMAYFVAEETRNAVREGADAVEAMIQALRLVETWWLEQGQHAHDGAPAAIFEARAALEKVNAL